MTRNDVLLLNKSTLCGSVRVPPSKSLAHRILITSALAGERAQLEYINKDAEATANCLDALGPYIEGRLSGRGSCDRGKVTLDVGESGSTLRFLLPIAAALGAKAQFTGAGRLAMRPLGELTDALAAHGVNISMPKEGTLPLGMSGKLRGGRFVIPANVSSQYISGLLLALPLVDEDSDIELVGAPVSKGYIDLTLNVLESSGIAVERREDGFHVPGRQRYAAPPASALERDWSSASFMLAAGALMGDVCVEGMSMTSAQGDRVVVELLRRFGADVSVDGDKVRCRRGKMMPIDFDAEDCPDLAPIMCAVAAFAHGVSTVRGVHRLRDKESDRLEAIMTMLRAAGIDSRAEDDALIIYGGEPHAAAFDGQKDHRMAMSAAVMGLSIGGSSLSGAECVSKSYPTFFEDAARLGARIQIVKDLT